MDRRNFVLTAGATFGSVAIAGCSGSQSSGSQSEADDFIKRSCTEADLVVSRIVEVDASTVDVVVENRGEDEHEFHDFLFLRDDGEVFEVESSLPRTIDSGSYISAEVAINGAPSSLAQVVTKNYPFISWDNYTLKYRTACIEREEETLSAKNLNVTGGWSGSTGASIEPQLEFENPTSEVITTFVGYYITINGELAKMTAGRDNHNQYIVPVRVPPNETDNALRAEGGVSYRDLTEEQINASSDDIELVVVIENEVVARFD